MPTDRLVAIWIFPDDHVRLRKRIAEEEQKTGRRNVTFGEMVHVALDQTDERSEAAK